ncbi:MAG: hypothetical protein DRG82_10180 [Deltaproteobacteria bacterium]|nr:MAG: hypothetical protein DRG82_10180 [Deltaproteobacteria bacterium]
MIFSPHVIFSLLFKHTEIVFAREENKQAAENCRAKKVHQTHFTGKQLSQQTGRTCDLKPA